MTKSAEEIIKSIGELVKDVWAHKESPEDLSTSLNDIAVLNWALSQWQAEFEEQERMMKAELDLNKATIIDSLTGAGDAVNKSEIRATIQLAEKRKEYNRAASGLEKVKITGKATEKVMDSIRSRISLIKQELAREQQ